eukprot:m.11359 g.11359  ORF g.11359 m.11359 type:complete len:377 (-) comp15407_c0_seq1:239-1369(-)
MRSLARPLALFAHLQIHAQAQARRFVQTSAERAVSLAIVRSEDTNIINNLALEDWYADHTDFQKQSVLLLWRNTRAVVIGRNQNVWRECNLQAMKTQHVVLARRRSGGGAVYHDMGNVNISFLTSRGRHVPKDNSAVIAAALKNDWRVDARVSPRNDLFVGDFKISGSAYKLDSKMAYHHCTLLLHADLPGLYEFLNVRRNAHIDCRGVDSVRSTVTNVRNFNGDVSFEGVCDSIAAAWQKAHGPSAAVSHHTVNPLDSTRFPGLDMRIAEFQSWDWRYGQSPSFSLTISNQLPGGNLNAQIELRRCAIESITLHSPPVSEQFATQLNALASRTPHRLAGYEELERKVREAVDPVHLPLCLALLDKLREHVAHCEE